MTAVLFEDPGVAQLYPVTVGKAAFTINCGGYRLAEQAATLDGPVCAIVRPHLRDVLASDWPELHLGLPKQSDRLVLFINARVVPSVAVGRELRRLSGETTPSMVRVDGQLAAALVPPESMRGLEFATVDEVASHLDRLALRPIEAALPLLEYPHDIVRHHLATVSDNLQARLADGGYRELRDGVLAADGAKIGQHVVVDASQGPIVLEEGASIGPYCFLRGPVHVGRNARVIEHSALKDGVVLGHTTKIGGEVEASIVEPYSNKQHHGFLGHSYLGSWINLGAGTCNSDLKNTYGPVNMIYRDQKVPTGMQFLGSIIGDYAKTAINTGIFTGKTIGVCSMVYGFVTTNVPSFVNYARLFGQVTATPVEVMVAAQARMFQRRGVTQRPCDAQLVREMFALTAHERELGSVPPEPLSL
ncbi:MAG: putative sugar nucleotidyl transferase [Pirellulales bacterium]